MDWALGLKIQSTMYNTHTAIALLNNKTFNFRDIKKHPSIQFSPLIDALLSLIKYEINMVRFRFTDCIVKINANWRKSGENDYVKKNLHANARAARPKPWRPKQLRKRKANYCGRLQTW